MQPLQGETVSQPRAEGTVTKEGQKGKGSRSFQLPPSSTWMPEKSEKTPSDNRNICYTPQAFLHASSGWFYFIPRQGITIINI